MAEGKTKKSKKPDKNEMALVEKQYPFTVAVNDFVDDIESIESSLFQVIMESLYKDYEKKKKSLDNLVSRKSKKTKKGKTMLLIESLSDFEDKFRSARQARLALDNVPNSIFVMLVSHLDNHFKRTLKIVLDSRKDLIDGTEKNISLSELFEMRNMDEAKAYVLDRELDDILNTRIKYFGWLKSKLKIDVQFDKVLFSRLYEITERRNLFVHTGGFVTQRYLDICKRQGLSFKEKTTSGDKIKIRPDYFAASFVTTYLVGVISTHIIWRELQPDLLEESDGNLNEKIVELLNRERYSIAYRLANFANSLQKFSSEETKLMFIINESLALKFLGEEKKSQEIINKIDWSATKEEFKMAVAIIKDDRDLVKKIMFKIGPNKDMKSAYKDWPLFKKFRKTKTFTSTYKAIYDEEYVTTAESVKDIDPLS